jgi:hypothetical protein
MVGAAVIGFFWNAFWTGVFITLFLIAMIGGLAWLISYIIKL